MRVRATILANIVLAVVAAVSLFLYATEAIKDKGTTHTPTAPTLAGVDYAKTHFTLVLVLRRTCQNCIKSMSFYQQLIERRNGSKRSLQIVCASRDDLDLFSQFLKASSVLCDGVSELNARTIPRFDTTPTLLVVDELGFIRQVFIGFLDEARTKMLLDTVGLAAPAV